MRRSFSPAAAPAAAVPLPRSLACPSLVLGLLLLSACSGGSAPLRPAGNLQATAIAVLSPEPTGAHELELSTRIAATADFTDVPVSWFLLRQEDVDAERDPVRQVLVGSSVLPRVAAAAADYRCTVVIPADAETAGKWYLVAHVDPENVVPETDEADNLPTAGPRLPITVDDTNSGRYDVVLESATIADEVVTLWPESVKAPVGNVHDVHDHDLSATLVVTTTGPLQGGDVDLSATITVPGRGSPPLMFWDETTGTYLNRTFAALTPGVPSTVHADMALLGSARSQVLTYLRTQPHGAATFTVTFRANALQMLPEWENGSRRHERADNECEAQVLVALAPEQPAGGRIAWERGFRKDWRNDVFRVGVDLRAAAALSEAGASGDTSALVPLTLFGKRADLLDFRAHARVLPRPNQPTDSEFALDLRVLGQTVYSRSAEDPQFTWETDWSIARTAEARGKVFAGPVPIDLIAGTTATLGFRVRTTLDPARFELQATPYAKAEAYAEASVNALVVKVGVRGQLTLLGEELEARTAAAITAPNAQRLDGTLTFELVNRLDGPSGRLWLFAERKVPKWCWTFVPCGIRTVVDEHTLARFATFRKVDVLFHDQAKTSVTP